VSLERMMSKEEFKEYYEETSGVRKINEEVS
jgi:hypothetical protein